MREKTECCELCFDGLLKGKPAIAKRRVPVAADWYGDRVEWRVFAACAECARANGDVDNDQSEAVG